MQSRFVVDVNVGRLAKWLRAMGYDTLFIPDVDDGELLKVAREQHRIVITRDRYILERRLVTSGEVEVVLVTSDDFREQMRNLIEVLGLHWNNGFSLCIECNTPLREVGKQAVKDRVPPFVFGTQEQFYECPECGKLYWRGTHWLNMRAEMAEFSKGIFNGGCLSHHQ